MFSAQTHLIELFYTLSTSQHSTIISTSCDFFRYNRDKRDDFSQNFEGITNHTTTEKIYLITFFFLLLFYFSLSLSLRFSHSLGRIVVCTIIFKSLFYILPLRSASKSNWFVHFQLGDNEIHKLNARILLPNLLNTIKFRRDLFSTRFECLTPSHCTR